MKKHKEKKRDEKAHEKKEQKMQKQFGSNREKVQSKISENLKSSKFRYLNEQLYKKHSGYAAEIFKESPHLFDDVSLLASF